MERVEHCICRVETIFSKSGVFLGTKTSGFDCIVIPGASKTGGSEVIATKQCGRSKGIVTAQGGASATVCSK